jgi:predicted DNA-binding ribbon-helix-helix protein
MMRDAVSKRSIVVCGHRTSVTMEDGFYEALLGIAHEQGRSLRKIAAEVRKQGRAKTLSAGLRLFVLSHYQERRP